MAKAKEKAGRTIRILVLHRGWVVVGDVEQDDREIRVTRGAFVRRWGTTTGLGQIAAGGPTQKTVLDPITTTMRVHPLAVVHSIDCNAAKWEGRV